MGLFDLFKATEEKEKQDSVLVEEDSVGNVIEDDLHQAAKDQLTEILDLMGFFNVVKVIKHDPGFVALEVKGDDLGRIIGKEGNTLYALQLILRNMLSRKYKRPVNVQIDANNYRDKRSATIRNIALEAAENVIKDGQEVVLQVMNAWERRVVHTTLMDHEKIKTESIGRDSERKVIVSLK
jgi:spoIIIJ-associated protein